jgi:hypothetical protein
MVISTKTSKKPAAVVIGTAGTERPAISAAIALAGVPEHPSGIPGKVPPMQTSRIPVIAPSPDTFAEFSESDAPVRAAAAALNPNKDSNNSVAFAAWLNVNIRFGLKNVPPGVSWTCSGSMGVANV